MDFLIHLVVLAIQQRLPEDCLHFVFLFPSLCLTDSTELRDTAYMADIISLTHSIAIALTHNIVEAI